MSETATSLTRTITLQNPSEALSLFGAGDVNLRRMRELVSARISARGETISIQGEAGPVEAAFKMIQDALDLVRGGNELTPDAILQVSRLSGEGRSLAAETQGSPTLPRGLKPKTPGQKLSAAARVRVESGAVWPKAKAGSARHLVVNRQARQRGRWSKKLRTLINKG